MPKFSYEASSDTNETTTGWIEAENVFQAISELESQGLHVTSIQLVDASQEAAAEPLTEAEKAKPAQIKELQPLRDRALELLKQRATLGPALAAFAEELPQGKTRNELSQFATRLKSDASNEELCADADLASVWLPLLGGAKSSNMLLSDVFEEANRESESRTQWMRAFLYPLMVFAVTVAVFIFLCITVVPSFRDIFDDFDMDLPELTKLVIFISEFFLGKPLTVAFMLLVVGTLAYSIMRIASSWSLPGQLGNALTTGNSRQVTAMSRFTKCLSAALASGLSLPTALRLAGQAEGTSDTREVVLHLANQLELGESDLQRSLYARRLPATLVHALQAGPDNQPSIPLLQHLADLYVKRVRDRCDWSTGFLAQFSIVGLGLAVGFVVLSLLLPLVTLINGLTG